MTTPNVLLIMGDEHAPMASSTWGGPARTPNLDALGAEGAVFDAAYCNSPLCVPSRMSLLTGRYAHDVDVFDLASTLSSDVPTIAHALRAVGYDAVLAGKQHFVGADQLHGFRAQLARDAHVGEHPLFSWPDDGPGPVWNFPHEAGPGHTDYLDADDEVEQATIDYLKGREADPSPWFMCASFITPHWPYVVPVEYWNQYPLDEVDVPAIDPEQLEGRHPVLKRLSARLGVDGYDDETTRRARAAYRAALTHLDDRVGRVLAALEATGQAENTLVIFTSDHGGMLGEHGLWRKMNFYEESVRVPLILRWPGVVSPDTRSATPVSLVDLAPTILGAAGAEPLDGVVGHDLVQTLRGNVPGRSVFSEYLGHGVAAPLAMLRRDKWKFVYYHGEAPQLFDLEADPGERRDLAGDPACQQVLTSLREELLDNWDPVTLDAEVRRSQGQRLLIRRAERQGASARNPAPLPD